MRLLSLLVLVIISGCATPSGPLATLPMGNPIGAHYNLEGIQFYNQEKWEEAKEKFERALQVDDTIAEVHFNLALSLHKLGRHEEAKKEFQRAGELLPDSKQIVETAVYRNHLGIASTFERHISGGYRY